MIEIPLSSVIIQNQPNSDENGESQNPQDPQNESTNEPTMIGLGPLRTANKLWIKQRIRASDILSNLTGCEVEKKFNIHGSEGEVLYSAKEKSNCCCRFCCGNIRTLDIRCESKKELIDFYTLIKSLRFKGQLISKRLFGILKFFQKTNERIRS